MSLETGTPGTATAGKTVQLFAHSCYRCPIKAHTSPHIAKADNKERASNGNIQKCLKIWTRTHGIVTALKHKALFDNYANWPVAWSIPHVPVLLIGVVLSR